MQYYIFSSNSSNITKYSILGAIAWTRRLPQWYADKFRAGKINAQVSHRSVVHSKSYEYYPNIKFTVLIAQLNIARAECRELCTPPISDVFTPKTFDSPATPPPTGSG